MRSILVPSAGLLLGVACSHAQPAPAAAPAQVVAEPTPAPAPPPAPEAVVARPPPEIAPASVYFDYDASELSDETRATLQSFFDQASQRPDQDVRIEGNCDERGTREYNLALGQRRADAARKYLENLGLESARITAVSNGRERPRAIGHNEAAWRQNRRDDLIPAPGKVAVSSSTDQTIP
jgi:peptidoglycan-associated lipoprotein